LGKLVTYFPETRVSEEGGVKLYTIPSVSNPFASPTLALTGKFLLIGMDAGIVSKAALADGPGALQALPAFASALPAYRTANEVFAFIDTRLIFERAYTALRPVILFATQVMPDVSSMIDTGKLPQTDTVARHLPPIIFSQQRLEDGVLLESSGPFTVSQLAIAAAGGGMLGFHPPH
jgi:hypothetical protein